MATITQGSAPNIVSATIYEERSGTLITAQVLDTSLRLSNATGGKVYTIIPAGQTPASGQIAIDGIQAGDTIIGVVPLDTYTAGVYLSGGSVLNSTSILLEWTNTNGINAAPATTQKTVGLMLYRPVTTGIKTAFEG